MEFITGKMQDKTSSRHKSITESREMFTQIRKSSQLLPLYLKVKVDCKGCPFSLLPKWAASNERMFPPRLPPSSILRSECLISSDSLSTLLSSLFRAFSNSITLLLCLQIRGDPVWRTRVVSLTRAGLGSISLSSSYSSLVSVPRSLPWRKSLGREENVNFDLVRCYIFLSFIKAGTAKGVSLRVMNSHTGVDPFGARRGGLRAESNDSVFPHDQFYVALSRETTRRTTKVARLLLLASNNGKLAYKRCCSAEAIRFWSDFVFFFLYRCTTSDFKNGTFYKDAHDEHSVYVYRISLVFLQIRMGREAWPPRYETSQSLLPELLPSDQKLRGDGDMTVYSWCLYVLMCSKLKVPTKESLSNDCVVSDGDTRRHIDDHTLPSLDAPMTRDKSLPRKVNIFMWRY
nr:hypothetical protein [Tanacetum cinerariifolium]